MHRTHPLTKPSWLSVGGEHAEGFTVHCRVAPASAAAGAALSADALSGGHWYKAHRVRPAQRESPAVKHLPQPIPHCYQAGTISRHSGTSLA